MHGNHKRKAANISVQSSQKNNGPRCLIKDVQDNTLVAKPASRLAGLGIKNFLKNKIVLVTGGTGFVAKVLVEKILRSQPDVGHIFLLINSKSSESAADRLKQEIQFSRLFQVLQTKHGDAYNAFFERKVTALAGNVVKSDLSLEPEVAQDLMSKVDVIVNSAATTNFIERYDVALNVNTKGPLHVLQFAQQCRRLKVFMHVSTAYVNGKRSGKTLEQAFVMDESISRDSLGDQTAPLLSVDEEIESVHKLASTIPAGDDQGHVLMKNLGMQRAAVHGWQDTYVFTKAMGEMLVCSNRGNVPVIIFRPAVIEGTFREPVSGWIEGVRMMDPILLSYGKGHFKSFYADPNGVLDVVPVDMVINGMLACMAKHAGEKHSLHVYHAGSSVVNPLTFTKIAQYTTEHFKSKPFTDTKGNPIVNPHFSLIDNRYAMLLENHLRFSLPFLVAKVFPWTQGKDGHRTLKYRSYASKIVEQLINTYSPYTFYKGRFDISNLQTLHEQMSPEERKEFDFAVWRIEWDKYITNIHLPGLRKYTLDGKNTTFRL